MQRKETKKLEFLLTKDQLNQIIDVLNDLSSIDDNIVLKIDSNNFLMYCVATSGDDRASKNILAFKSFNYDTPSITTLKSELEGQIIFIIRDTKKTVTNLRNYLDYDDAIQCTITYDSINDLFFGDTIKFKNNKLKLNFNGGSPRDSNIKISLKSIQEKSTPELLEFKFNMSKIDYDKSRKMSLIEKDNDMIYFNIQGGKLSVAENRWALELMDIDYKNDDSFGDINVCIPKKYYKTAKCDDKGLDVEVYRSHIIINNNKASLMISRQMTLR